MNGDSKILKCLIIQKRRDNTKTQKIMFYSVFKGMEERKTIT